MTGRSSDLSISVSSAGVGLKKKIEMKLKWNGK